MRNSDIILPRTNMLLKKKKFPFCFPNHDKIIDSQQKHTIRSFNKTNLTYYQPPWLCNVDIRKRRHGKGGEGLPAVKVRLERWMDRRRRLLRRRWRRRVRLEKRRWRRGEGMPARQRRWMWLRIYKYREGRRDWPAARSVGKRRRRDLIKRKEGEMFIGEGYFIKLYLK